jgi:predicted RecA/RadA family phage recombinase
MAKNYVQTGENLTVPAPANIISGSGVLVGSIFGVALVSALSGEELDMSTVGVWNLPKVSAQAIAVGAKVYWDDTAKLVTTTATSNTLIGVAVTAAANPSGTVNVRLNGSFA